MNNSDEFLNEESIDKYCEALSEELLKANLGEHKMLIVGGAAMALKFRDGRSTIDIDICIKERFIRMHYKTLEAFLLLFGNNSPRQKNL